MDTLQFPISFENGDAVKLTQGSRAYYEHLLSMAISTRLGELKLTPNYGIIDGAFDSGAKEQLLILTAQNFPELKITKISEKLNDNGGTDTFEITFDIVG